jgi:hypothetical protein
MASLDGYEAVVFAWRYIKIYQFKQKNEKRTKTKNQMNKTVCKILALIFGLLSLGGLSESYRIMTSNATDIAQQRGYLTIMALGILAVMLMLTIYFWRKSK